VKNVRQTLLGVLVMLLLAAPAAHAAGVVVKEVRVEGTRRTDPAKVLAAVGTKAGESLDPERLDADLRAIMKLGSYSDVQIEQEGPAANPVIVYRVVERPLVHEAKTVGNVELKKDDLKDTVSLKAGTVWDPAVARKDVEKIQKAYVDKGYFLTDVATKVTQLPDNQVDVTYQVNEHAKVEVKALRFVGNDHVPKDDIVPFLRTKEGSIIPFMGGGTFSEEAFENDLHAVQAVYLEKGYVEAKVRRASVQLSPDRRYLFVTIPVVEGPQYDLGEISFAGELLGKEDELHKVVRSRTGERFVRSRVAADIEAIQDLYRDMGYAYVNVEPRTMPHPDQRRVDLQLGVQPGEQVRIGRIEIAGNLRTRDKVIRREIRLYEGQLYNGTGFRDSKRRITALGFFETVEIAEKKRTPQTMDILVTVKERPTGSFQLSAGFSSYENFILNGQISQNNFFGWGQTLSLQLQWSAIRQQGQITFVEPYFLDTRWTFSFDLYANEVAYSYFTRQSVGGTMTWGYELVGLSHWWPLARKLEDVRLFATYKNEVVHVATENSVQIARASGSGTTSALQFMLQADKRDNRITPTNGWYGALSFETAPPFLAPKSLFGSEVNLFNRYTVDLRGYHPVYGPIIGRARLSLGWLQSLTNQGVPISELYFLGGVNTVRGYRFGTIAPQDLMACTSNPYTTLCRLYSDGYQQAIVNLEAEFPLVEKAGVRGVVFFDAGNAFRAGSFHDSNVPWSLYKSVGIGFRWSSPLGPLRFEWGFQLDRRKDSVGNWIDNSVDFQFTIGNFF
jgi:outer membrane protein insertion porin family